MGLRFRVEAAEVQELWRGEGPRALARRLALAKAERVHARRPRSWCLGADTVVAIGDVVLGKPASPSEAAAMLTRLSGRTHTVITGVALLGPGFRAVRAVATRVRFRRLSRAEVRAYVAAGESMDKAGGYAVQGLGGLLVERIDGDWSNVVGLPLGAVREMLRAAAGRRRSRAPNHDRLG
jgi:septum formation protein